MKVNLGAFLYFYYNLNCKASNPHSCSFRWPAISVDHYAYEGDPAHRYLGKDTNFIMGALLALKPSFNLDTLKTIPGKILGKAFQDYGAYVVDDAYCDCWAPVFERGPDGNVVDEVQKKYNVDVFLTPKTDEFWKDMVKVFENLHIIINNGPNTIGGGGTPRQPLAPPFTGTGTAPQQRVMKTTAAASPAYAVAFAQKTQTLNMSGVKRIYTVRGERVTGREGVGNKSVPRLPAGVYIIEK
jgi:hypothetical protein